MNRLEGKIAIVTGAARGMGAAHASKLVQNGARVLLADVLDDEGQHQADGLGPAARFVHLDVTSASDWRTVLNVAADVFGLPNVLVNNAGVNSATKAPICELSSEEFLRTLEVNLHGTFLGLKHVGKAMIEEDAGGSIINVSSVGGMHGAAGSAAYVASKWAVRGLSKTAAIEFGSAGIRVNTIFPGLTDTPMIQADTLPSQIRDGYGVLGRIADPAEIASLVVFLASDESSFSTGAEFVADGGRSASFGAAANGPI
jgi:3alpha(or 20beta)-hydroxysteroid dehydrogenase